MDFEKKLNELFVEVDSKIDKRFIEMEQKFKDFDSIEFLARQRPNSTSCNNNEDMQHKHFVEYLKTGSNLAHKDFSGSCGTDIECANGGYLVSQRLNNEIVSISSEENILRKLAKIQQVRGDRNEYIQTLDKIGDLGWVTETADRIGNSKVPALSRIVIKLYEMYAQPTVSKNLLNNDSAIDIYNWLKKEIADAFTETEIKGFLNGDGKTKPQGILSSGTGIEQITTQEVKNIKFEDILALYASLDMKYRVNASFIMSPKTQMTLFGLKDSNGRPLWQQSFIEKAPSTLLGIPVYFSSYLPSGDTTGDTPIIFGDFKSGYFILDCAVNNFIRDELTEKQWVKFYTTKRVGGAVMNPNALKILKVK